MCFGWIAYLLLTLPFEENSINRIILFNEFSLLTILALHYALTDAYDDTFEAEIIVIVSYVFLIMANLFFMLLDIYREFKIGIIKKCSPRARRLTAKYPVLKKVCCCCYSKPTDQ